MKTGTLISVTVTICVVLAMIVFLVVSDKDIQPVLIALPVVAGVIGTIFQINNVGKKVETVQHQTNGTLKKKDAEIIEKEAEIKALRTLLTVEQVAQIPERFQVH